MPAGSEYSLPHKVTAPSFASPPSGDTGIAAALAEGRPAMIVERPEIFGSRQGPRPLEVSGWAWSGSGIETVLVVVDGEIEVRALHDLFRPDLRSLFGDDLATSGFTVRLDPRDWAPGWHELTVVATDGEGRAIGVSGKVESVDQPPPRMSAAGTIDPMPSGGDGHDERFVPTIHRSRTPAAEHRARYRWAAPLLAGGAILDVSGGGAGPDMASLTAQARQAICHDGDLLDLPFDDGAFNAVLCFEAIERAADTDRALDELRRVLAPDGMLLISSANRDAYPPGNPLHLHQLSSDELDAALRARFANVAIHRQESYLASLAGDDAALEDDDAARAIHAAIAGATGGPRGAELHTVAAATDGDLPPPPAELALGPALPADEPRRLTEAWRERCAAAELAVAKARSDARFQQRALAARLERHASTAAALGDRVREVEQDLHRARTSNAALLESVSWRVTAPLRNAKRRLQGGS